MISRVDESSDLSRLRASEDRQRLGYFTIRSISIYRSCRIPPHGQQGRGSWIGALHGLRLGTDLHIDEEPSPALHACRDPRDEVRNRDPRPVPALPPHPPPGGSQGGDRFRIGRTGRDMPVLSAGEHRPLLHLCHQRRRHSRSGPVLYRHPVAHRLGRRGEARNLVLPGFRHIHVRSGHRLDQRRRRGIQSEGGPPRASGRPDMGGLLDHTAEDNLPRLQHDTDHTQDLHLRIRLHDPGRMDHGIRSGLGGL